MGFDGPADYSLSGNMAADKRYFRDMPRKVLTETEMIFVEVIDV